MEIHPTAQLMASCFFINGEAKYENYSKYYKESKNSSHKK